MTTTMPETVHDQDVVLIALDAIAPDPKNPRRELRAIEALAANIRLHGVRTPISVRPAIGAERTNGTTHIIISGERRWTASKVAEQGTIRAIVEQDRVGIEAAVDRMVENLQRDNFDALEEAAGVQQILDLGTTEEETATLLSIDPGRVSTSSRIAKAKAPAIVAKRFDLTFEQAAGLAEFDTNKEVIKELTNTLEHDPESWDQTIEQYRDQRAMAEMRVATETEWVEKGYMLLKRDTMPATTRPLNQLKAGTKNLTTAAHKSCPGRGVIVGVHQVYNSKERRYEAVASVTEYCTDPETNGHKLPAGMPASSPSGGQRTDTRTEAQKQADLTKNRTHRAALDAGRTAQPLRRKFVTRLLQHKGAPAGVLRFATEAISSKRIDPEPPIEELTGQDLKKGDRYESQGDRARRALVTYAKGKTDAQQPLVLLALVASDIECAWEPNTWDLAGFVERSALRKAYLELLVKNGYAPSTIEKVLLGTAKPADVLAEHERIKAATRANKGPVTPSGRKSTASTHVDGKPVRRPVKKAVKRQPARRRASAK